MRKMSLKLPAKKWEPEKESMTMKEKEYSSISNLCVLVCDFGIRHLALPLRYLSCCTTLRFTSSVPPLQSERLEIIMRSKIVPLPSEAPKKTKWAFFFYNCPESRCLNCHLGT